MTLIHGNNIDVLKNLESDSVDSIVTDPPYGLSFMNNRWDYDVPSIELWQECLRVLKPGGYLLAFSGTRTYHRMVVRIEDAGFEIRDMIAWIYGSGFPKSLNISKAIDKAAGAERDVVGVGKGRTGVLSQPNKGSVFSDDAYQWPGNFSVTVPATEEAKQWDGWGTALKPAIEPIVMARKPLSEKTVAANVLKHGTGAINIDGCRIHSDDAKEGRVRHGGGIVGNGTSYELPDYKSPMPAGRWPANIMHDGSEEVESIFPYTKSGAMKREVGEYVGDSATKFLRGRSGPSNQHGEGSASRFFYCAKASKKDRGEGNNHPTVKPTDLMKYLCRLVTPPGGTVLDPFMGSGSTGKAAILEGFDFIGIELDEGYYRIANDRINGENSMNESNRSHTLKLTKDNIKEWKEEYDRVFSSLGIEVSSPPSEMVSDQEHLYMWADCTPHEAAMEELSCWSK